MNIWSVMEFQTCLLPRVYTGFDCSAVCHVAFGQWNDELCKKLIAWNGRVHFPMKLLVHWMETADCCPANWPCKWSSLVAKKGDRETNDFLKTFQQGRAAPFLMAVLSDTPCWQQITMVFCFGFSCCEKWCQCSVLHSSGDHCCKLLCMKNAVC